MIRVTHKHEACGGTGERRNAPPDSDFVFRQKCPDCDNGVITLEVEWDENLLLYEYEQYQAWFEINGEFVIKIRGSRGNITDSLNIIRIDHITTEECPDCMGTKAQVFGRDRDGNIKKCSKCRGVGKVEKITSTQFLGDSLEKHEEALILKGILKERDANLKIELNKESK